jgi:Polyketide cyclase / dehydrase and lipid transport
VRAIEETIDIAAPAAAVFDLIHDYGRRLEWDRFLREARLLDGAQTAGLGVKSLCVARKAAGGSGMETVYVSFDRPRVAAVKMTRGPFYIDAFAASLRQIALRDGRTRVSYKFHIAGRPRWLRFLLEPLLAAVFRRETRRRLQGLKRFLEADALPPEE